MRIHQGHSVRRQRQARPRNLLIYNAAPRAAYATLILTIIVLALSGLAIWKPIQFQGLAGLMGGYEGARLVHFFAMTLTVLIVIIHVGLE